jgi:glyoxylase-like metal-dependent hydrolase (beta-lactamase superfamily II)
MACGGLSMMVAAAQAPPAPKPIEMQKVRDNVYVLLSNIAGSPEFTGGASTVFITDAGVVLVDTKNAGQGPIILERLKSITDKPVTMIINTHTHGDHTGNNGFFGATVDSVVHENTKINMQKLAAFQGENAKFLPKQTFKDRMSLTSGKERIDLYHFGRGHTNGDAVVVFPSVRVAATGDLFSGKNPPRIDPANGGSGVEYPKTAARMLAGLPNVETIVTGHSRVMTWQDAQEWGRFQDDFFAAIEASLKSGKSVDETAASVATSLSDKYKEYGLQGAFKDRVREDVEIVSKELKQ